MRTDIQSYVNINRRKMHLLGLTTVSSIPFKEKKNETTEEDYDYREKYANDAFFNRNEYKNNSPYHNVITDVNINGSYQNIMVKKIARRRSDSNNRSHNNVLETNEDFSRRYNKSGGCITPTKNAKDNNQYNLKVLLGKNCDDIETTRLFLTIITPLLPSHYYDDDSVSKTKYNKRKNHNSQDKHKEGERPITNSFLNKILFQHDKKIEKIKTLKKVFHSPLYKEFFITRKRSVKLFTRVTKVIERDLKDMYHHYNKLYLQYLLKKNKKNKGRNNNDNTVKGNTTQTTGLTTPSVYLITSGYQNKKINTNTSTKACSKINTKVNSRDNSRGHNNNYKNERHQNAAINHKPINKIKNFLLIYKKPINSSIPSPKMIKRPLYKLNDIDRSGAANLIKKMEYSQFLKYSIKKPIIESYNHQQSYQQKDNLSNNVGINGKSINVYLSKAIIIQRLWRKRYMSICKKVISIQKTFRGYRTMKAFCSARIMLFRIPFISKILVVFYKAKMEYMFNKMIYYYAYLYQHKIVVLKTEMISRAYNDYMEKNRNVLEEMNCVMNREEWNTEFEGNFGSIWKYKELIRKVKMIQGMYRRVKQSRKIKLLMNNVKDDKKTEKKEISVKKGKTEPVSINESNNKSTTENKSKGIERLSPIEKNKQQSAKELKRSKELSSSPLTKNKSKEDGFKDPHNYKKDNIQLNNKSKDNQKNKDQSNQRISEIPNQKEKERNNSSKSTLKPTTPSNITEKQIKPNSIEKKSNTHHYNQSDSKNFKDLAKQEENIYKAKVKLSKKPNLLTNTTFTKSFIKIKRIISKQIMIILKKFITQKLRNNPKKPIIQNTVTVIDSSEIKQLSIKDKSNNQAISKDQNDQINDNSRKSKDNKIVYTQENQDYNDELIKKIINDCLSSWFIQTHQFRNKEKQLLLEKNTKKNCVEKPSKAQGKYNNILSDKSKNKTINHKNIKSKLEQQHKLKSDLKIKTKVMHRYSLKPGAEPLVESLPKPQPKFEPECSLLLWLEPKIENESKHKPNSQYILEPNLVWQEIEYMPQPIFQSALEPNLQNEPKPELSPNHELKSNNEPQNEPNPEPQPNPDLKSQIDPELIVEQKPKINNNQPVIDIIINEKDAINDVKEDKEKTNDLLIPAVNNTKHKKEVEEHHSLEKAVYVIETCTVPVLLEHENEQQEIIDNENESIIKTIINEALLSWFAQSKTNNKNIDKNLERLFNDSNYNHIPLLNDNNQLNIPTKHILIDKLSKITNALIQKNDHLLIDFYYHKLFHISLIPSHKEEDTIPKELPQQESPKSSNHKDDGLPNNNFNNNKEPINQANNENNNQSDINTLINNSNYFSNNPSYFNNLKMDKEIQNLSLIQPDQLNQTIILPNNNINSRNKDLMLVFTESYTDSLDNTLNQNESMKEIKTNLCNINRRLRMEKKENSIYSDEDVLYLNSSNHLIAPKKQDSQYETIHHSQEINIENNRENNEENNDNLEDSSDEDSNDDNNDDIEYESSG